MRVNIEKIRECYRVFTMWLGELKSRKLPLWLYIVVFLVSALFVMVVSCSHDKLSTTALVGRTEYNGHQYLVFRTLDDKHTVTVVHDPDCICNYYDQIEE